MKAMLVIFLVLFFLVLLVHASGIHPLPANWPYIEKDTVASQFVDMSSSSNFFKVAVFFLPSLITCQSFMPISRMVLEL